MKSAGVIKGIGARQWRGVVRGAGENWFAAWIAARWAPPERVRRLGPQRDFRAPRRSVPWLSLTANVWQPSWQVNVSTTARGTWAFGSRKWLYCAPAPWRSTDVAWTSLLSSVGGASYSFPANHFYSLALNRAGTAVVGQAYVAMPAPPSTGAASASTAPDHLAGGRLEKTVWHRLSHRFAHFSFAGLPFGIGQDAGGHLALKLARPLQAMSVRQAQTFHKQFFSAIATVQLAAHSIHTLATLSDGPMFTGIRAFRREIDDQLHLLAPRAVSCAPTERSRRTQVELHLRAIAAGGWGRPSMQFTQPASASGQELVSAIRAAENAVAKIQSAPIPPASQAPDMQRLTAQVYDHLERQLRIERERRGRN